MHWCSWEGVWSKKRCEWKIRQFCFVSEQLPLLTRSCDSCRWKREKIIQEPLQFIHSCSIYARTDQGSGRPLAAAFNKTHPFLTYSRHQLKKYLELGIFNVLKSRLLCWRTTWLSEKCLGAKVTASTTPAFEMLSSLFISEASPKWSLFGWLKNYSSQLLTVLRLQHSPLFSKEKEQWKLWPKKPQSSG